MSGKLGIYGEPNAQQSFKDEVGMLLLEIEEQTKKTAPEYAFSYEENKILKKSAAYTDELASNIVDKKSVHKIGEELFCCDNGMSHFTVDEVKFFDVIPDIDESKLLLSSFYDAVDKETGKINSMLGDSIQYM